MNIDILEQWILLDYIQYMIMATILLGVMKTIKYLIIRK